jgi:hypothetical protein
MPTIATCQSCKKNYQRVCAWQSNCLACWNRLWGGLPSSAETKAMVLQTIGDEYVSAPDFARRTRMPLGAIWPSLMVLAFLGELDVASYVNGKIVPCGRGPYVGETLLRRRQAA